MTTDLGRQFATGVAAFFLTALLLLANAPGDRGEAGWQLQHSEAAGRIDG